jgi:hypothetical protein
MNTIIYNNLNQKLEEEEQNIKTKFFFVEKQEDYTYTQITPYIQCRDFLNDVLYCITFNTKIHVYNFKYESNNTQKDTLYLNLKFCSKKAVEEFKENFHYLLKFETLYKFLIYTTYEKTNKPTVLLIKHNPFWFSNTLTLSFFTFILRCLSHPNITGNFWEFILNTRQLYKKWNGQIIELPSKESRYIEDTPLLSYFVKNLPKISSTYKQKEYSDKYDIHNFGGFICYLTETNITYPLTTIIKDNPQCQEDVLDVIPS